MHITGITLFGKHPAWSDHMYVAASEGAVANLKRIFYDHSVIPALQGTDSSKDLPDPWNLIAVVDRQVFYIVSVSSSDSIGRKRFPLMAALPLPSGICLEAAASLLDNLKAEVCDFLKDILRVPEDDDLEAWQQLVVEKAKSFITEVDWAMADELKANRSISASNLASLMTRLQEGLVSLNLRPHSYEECCVLLEAAIAQYQDPVAALLVLDSVGTGDVLLLDAGAGSRFNLERYLQGDLPYLDVSPDRVPKKVKRLVEPPQGAADAWPISEVPSLGINRDSEFGGVLHIPRKFLFLFAFVALIGAILIGVIFGGSGDSESASNEEASFPARDAWILAANDYVDWIQDLLEYMQQEPDRFDDSPELKSATERELNPFSVVNEGQVRMDLVDNPTNRIFRPDNLKQLNVVYTNIDKLKDAVKDYYVQHQANKLLDGLIDQGYQIPPYLSHLSDSDATMPTLSSADVDPVDPADPASPVKPLMPAFDASFVEQLIRFTLEYEQAADLTSVVEQIESGAIKPLAEHFPEHAQLIRQYLQDTVRNVKDAEDLSLKKDQLRQSLDLPEFVDFTKIDLDALQEEQDWQLLPAGDPSPESVARLVDLLRAHYSVAPAKFADLQSDLRTAARQLQSQLERMQSDFPPEAIESDEIQALLADVDRFVASISALVRIQSQYAQAQFGFEQWSQQLNQQQETLEMKHQQLADPDTWIQSLSPQLATFSNQSLVTMIPRMCEDVKRSILADSSLTHVQAYQRFRLQAERLIEIFTRIDPAFMEQQSEQVAAYLVRAGAREKLQSYVSAQAASIPASQFGMDQFGQEIEQVRTSIEQYLSAFFQTADSLEASYAAMDAAASPVETLRDEIRTHINNPLYLEDSFIQRLDLLEAAFLGRVVSTENPQQLYWYIHAMESAHQITEEMLLKVVADFKMMPDLKFSHPLSSAIRRCFNSYTSHLAELNARRGLALFARLDAYLPKRLQFGHDQDYQEIALYWQRYNDSSNLELPSEAELRQASDATESNLLKLFYTNLIEVRASADELAGESGLEKIKQSSNVIRSVEYDRANSRIDILFEGDAGMLSFLPVKTDSGVIYVQRRPLTLEHLIRLAKACGSPIDTFRYDSRVWPRPFLVTKDGHIISINGWQFQQGEVFEPIVGFSKSQIPAHANEPQEVLKIARICGVRLLRPQEAADFIAMDPNYSRAPVDFDPSQWPQLQVSKTLEGSVYAKRILGSGQGVRTVSGIDFERGESPDNQFSEIIGGSAELVYDDARDRYYACGGSWLFTPQEHSNLEPITDPSRMYIDLGARFVFDAPAPTYAELVEQVATRLIKDRRNLRP